MSRLVLPRLGDPTMDRALDELQRWGATVVAGQLGPRQKYLNGAQTVLPAVANPRGRVLVYCDTASAVFTDGGLTSTGAWALTLTGGPCTAQFLWLE